MGTARQRLWEVALDQHGFVTTDDARAVEVTPDAIKLLARRGTLHREAHGVYRFVNFPASRADDYQQAVLWTGQPLAALSHETALELLELGDVNPDRIHVTVPPGARVRRRGGERIALHEEFLPAGHVGWWQGIRCVKAKVAIRQVITAGRTPVHLIRQALASARERGAITAAAHSELTVLMEHVLPSDPFAALPDKDRFPKSARILDGWVRDAQKLIGARGDRVGWILASTIVAAALQRELRDGTPVFLLKAESSSSASSISTRAPPRTSTRSIAAPRTTSSTTSTGHSQSHGA